MKIKELKSFLKVRGVACPDCLEKSDFVRKALEVRSQPSIHQAAAPVKVSSEPLWDQWSAVARTICEEVVSAEQKEQKYCKVLADATENVVMRYGKRYVKELSVEKQQLTKYTFTHPYKSAGETRIRRVAKWMAAKGNKKLADVEARLETPLQSWLRDSALQNINTMLDTLQGSDEL